MSGLGFFLSASPITCILWKFLIYSADSWCFSGRKFVGNEYRSMVLGLPLLTSSTCWKIGCIRWIGKERRLKRQGLNADVGRQILLLIIFFFFNIYRYDLHESTFSLNQRSLTSGCSFYVFYPHDPHLPHYPTCCCSATFFHYMIQIYLVLIRYLPHSSSCSATFFALWSPHGKPASP